MVRTPTDEITIRTEHWPSDEWKSKGRVAGAKLNPDLVWLRLDSEGVSSKVVVDVKNTSTAYMNKAFKEKDEKYRQWAKRETREKKVVMAVMVPLIISHDGAVQGTQSGDGRTSPRTSRVDCVRMAQSVLRTMW